ncbi:histone H2A-beta, sperm-like [Carassius gibelio]|uniref:histone H2A-beta, sperm-like n=1 Tax=Carassius gibelio TaxID=101364 RepID=UPI0022786C7F|nr:histone H2A-beta, sperm-like [Carassius gibelio]
MRKKTKPVSDLSSRAGLVFPVQHFHQALGDGKLPRAVDEEAAVFLTAVLEFLVAEILTLAGQDAVLNQSNKITLHHLPGLQDKRRYAMLLEEEKEEEEEEEEEEEVVGVTLAP